MQGGVSKFPGEVSPSIPFVLRTARERHIASLAKAKILSDGVMVHEISRILPADSCGTQRMPSDGGHGHSVASAAEASAAQACSEWLNGGGAISVRKAFGRLSSHCVAQDGTEVIDMSRYELPQQTQSGRLQSEQFNAPVSTSCIRQAGGGDSEDPQVEELTVLGSSEFGLQFWGRHCRQSYNSMYSSGGLSKVHQDARGHVRPRKGLIRKQRHCHVKPRPTSS